MTIIKRTLKSRKSRKQMEIENRKMILWHEREENAVSQRFHLANKSLKVRKANWGETRSALPPIIQIAWRSKVRSNCGVHQHESQ